MSDEYQRGLADAYKVAVEYSHRGNVYSRHAGRAVARRILELMPKTPENEQKQRALDD